MGLQKVSIGPYINHQCLPHPGFIALVPADAMVASGKATEDTVIFDFVRMKPLQSDSMYLTIVISEPQKVACRPTWAKLASHCACPILSSERNISLRISYLALNVTGDHRCLQLGDRIE